MDFEALDPEDWEPTRKLAHDLVDGAIDHTRDVRDRPIWREMPADIRAQFETVAPQEPEPLGDILGDVRDTLMQYPMGNIHPRFLAWYMGTSNFTGALADFIAAIQGSNLGGGNHAAALIDRQVVEWLRQMIGLPAGASGTLVSGGSVANLIGLTVARNTKAGIDLREHGLAALPAPMRFYGSDQLHGCHQQAMETLGLGNRALIRIATHNDLTIDIEALKQAVATDRANGITPACVIATAGTVNTGAFDDLTAIADFCAAEDLWFHVDGCIGALIAIAPENRWRVAGIERADSVALDPHKWLHAPFDVGCALVRSKSQHLETFSLSSEYLESTARGVAAAPFLHDFGIQTSRGFRALKVWMSLREHGVRKFGRLIDQDIAKGAYLSQLIEQSDSLALLFPTNINIVCFRYDPGGMDDTALKSLNTEIMLRLQEDGTAVLSDTTVHGQHCLRAAINNHRTRPEDLDLLIREIERLGTEIRGNP
ncbi:pyridoxal-dependent decarboxylase [uncultured Roseovarius sp.]|uniref:pyridoxal phosphate-dependent decarboxylase family protein n=1 Tax=uncultured Roseovarius sp. TaxID=293344 RepID=UPI0026343430|nr:pyridoxal-dependent decarboxylase [uncultured Roseovarius sp.]